MPVQDLDELKRRSREQVLLYEQSGGTEGTLNRMGYPVVIVTSVGARTGQERKFPVIRVERDGEHLVVASLGGNPRNPQWYYNVVANPRVWLQDGPTRSEHFARELVGDERLDWWSVAVDRFPPYAEYQAETERVIPLLLLTPAASKS
jgi:deazaflavin-dependent oxidoreductase (nitroreductase family)